MDFEKLNKIEEFHTAKDVRIKEPSNLVSSNRHQYSREELKDMNLTRNRGQ
jgi:hypothetical protein